MALTDLQVNKLRPRSGRFEVSDGKGLSIRITPEGSKTWVFRYVFGQKETLKDGKRIKIPIPRRMTLGSYPGTSLAEARELHAKALQDVKKGIDPGLKQKEAKAALKAAPTISELIDEFWDMELQSKKSGVETKRLLDKDIIPAWKNRKVADIKRRDIVLLLDAVRKRAPITANRVLGALTRMFNFAAERGIIEDSPCTRIRKGTEKGRDRVLTDEEIRLLWAALDLDNRQVDMYHLTKLALKMILLTGQRPGEVTGMAWDEINDTSWNIPKERMKNAEPQQVPLTYMALEIIECAKPYSNGPYVFISPQGPGFARKRKSQAKVPQEHDAPMTAHALSRALVRHWVEIGFKEDAERFTPHDLRRTVRTRLASLGVDDVVGEKVLGHKLQGVLSIYNRHSYADEKRKALERWERELKRILGIDMDMPGNVIPFKGRS